MATLNIAKSRRRPSTWSLVRIDQTFFVRSGGFDPIILLLFQGTRGVPSALRLSSVSMLISSVTEADQHARMVEAGDQRQVPEHSGLI
jgi:hypothetical protein